MAEFVILTATGGGGYGLPVVGAKPDVLLREGVRVSDLTEAERQAAGLATLHEEAVPAHYDRGAPSDTLDAAGVHRTYPAQAVNLARLRLAIRAEAERRIDEGFLLPSGIRFRCKTPYAVRIIDLSDDADPDSYPFTTKTESGADLVVASQADAQAVRGAARGYIRAVLEASSSLQDQAAAGTFTDDPQAWAGWPSDGS